MTKTQSHYTVLIWIQLNFRIKYEHVSSKLEPNKLL